MSAHTSTVTALDGINQREFDWIYSTGWNSINALTAHVAALKHLYRAMGPENRTPTEEELAAWMPAVQLGEHVVRLGGVSPEQRIAEMREGMERLSESLGEMSREDFVRRREGIFGAQGYNLAWALFHLVEDETHHRGQITILRKLYREAEEAR